MFCWIRIWVLALLGHASGLLLRNGTMIDQASNDAGLALSAAFIQTGQLESQGKTVTLGRWCGRLGDNLFRLLNALRYAEENGFDHLQVPSVDRNWRVENFFHPAGGQSTSQPWRIQVNAQASQGRKLCETLPTNDICAGYPYSCAGMNLQDRYRVMQTYVKPLLRVPKDPFKDRHEELVIHIRSGDTMTQTRFGNTVLLEARQPPCAVYHKIISKGVGGKRFERVRIITEGDRGNPCIQQIVDRHDDKIIKVQSNERSVDASAIINARHLVASHTYFTSLLMLLNSNLETLVTVDYGDRMSHDLYPCDANKVKIFSISFPFMGKVYEPQERAKWMANFPEQKLEMRQTC